MKVKTGEAAPKPQERAVVDVAGEFSRLKSRLIGEKTDDGKKGVIKALVRLLFEGSLADTERFSLFQGIVSSSDSVTRGLLFDELKESYQRYDAEWKASGMTVGPVNKNVRYMLGLIGQKMKLIQAERRPVPGQPYWRDKIAPVRKRVRKGHTAPLE